MKSAGDSAVLSANGTPTGAGHYVDPDEVAARQRAGGLSTNILVDSVRRHVRVIAKRRSRIDYLLRIALEKLPENTDVDESQAILETLICAEGGEFRWDMSFEAEVAELLDRLQACEAARGGRLA